MDDGKDHVVFISGDFMFFTRNLLRDVKAEVKEKEPRIDGSKIILHATHTLHRDIILVPVMIRYTKTGSRSPRRKNIAAFLRKKFLMPYSVSKSICTDLYGTACRLGNRGVEQLSSDRKGG